MYKRQVGYLSAGSPAGAASDLLAFQQGLSETGYVEGRNVAVEYRWADGQLDRLPAFAADLARRKVSVFATGNVFAVRAVKAVSKAIPIVFGIAGDPVQAGGQNPSLPTPSSPAAALVAAAGGAFEKCRSEKPNAISHFNADLERIGAREPVQEAAKPVCDMMPDELRKISKKLSTYARFYRDDRESARMAVRCAEVAELLERAQAVQVQPVLGGPPVTDGQVWLPGTCSVPGCAHQRTIGKLAREGVEAPMRVIYGENLSRPANMTTTPAPEQMTSPFRLRSALS